MYTYYRTTPLEQWVEHLWIKSGIAAPAQLNVEEVASRLDVWVHFMNDTSRALDYMGMRSILVDRRLDKEAQWEDFLHELCHILRHAGNQTVMPKLFCEGQEAEANRFVLYAAIPFYMLRQLKLPARIDEAVETIAIQFGVTYELARKRLEQLQRRTLAAILWEEAIKQETQSGFHIQAKSTAR